MLRAIIADDEEMVRHGLRNHYHWDKYDISICGDFSDGRAALEYLENNKVDLLVTDVVMPYINGLELAKKARELNPELKIIFISGYADVTYLSDALRMNAVDYIFKSIDFDALDSAIERVIDIVKKHRTEKEKIQWLEDQLEKNIEILRQQRLSSLLENTDESESSMASTCSALSLSLNSQSDYIVMVTQVSNRWNLVSSDEHNGQSELMLDLSIQNTLEKCIKRRCKGELFKRRAYEYICILNTDMDEYEDLLLTVGTEIQTELKRKFDADIEIGISQRFQGLKSARMAYRGACEAISRRYVLDESLPDISINKYPPESQLICLREKIKSEINQSILDGNPEQIHRTVVRCFSTILSLKSKEEQQNQMIYMLMLPQKLLRDIRPEDRACYASHRKLLEEFFKLQSLREQEGYITQIFTQAAAAIDGKNSSLNNSTIKRVISYIDEHYMDALSVDNLAESVYLTPTYLCVLFKKSTGKTINHYLTEVRLEKAKELLKNDAIHLQDICFRVGYLSPSYFSRLFKKYFGQTPSEYRDSVVLSEQ